MPSSECDIHTNTVLCCPNCGHTGLYYETGMKLGPIYHCKRCGYIGTFVIEANKCLRQTIQKEPLTIDVNPFTADEYILLKRKFLYLSIAVTLITFSILGVSSEYSVIVSLILVFVYVLSVVFVNSKKK